MKTLRYLLWLTAFLALFGRADAQITVELSVKRRLFIAHEPIVATVTLTNLTGRDITLADTPEMLWFGFQVTGASERIFPPRNPNYSLDPIEIKSGEQKRRTVNLNELYEIGDYGIYRVRANIFYSPTQKFFSSKATVLEITDGQLLWTKVVGVPGGSATDGNLRHFSLLAHQQGDLRMLYVRVEDRENGIVFCTQEIGRMIEGQGPVAEFDRANNLYILHLIGQREYLLTKMGINGEFMGSTRYTAPKTRPTFRRLADGPLQILGPRREVAVAQGAVASDPPSKLSARPPGMPAN